MVRLSTRSRIHVAVGALTYLPRIQSVSARAILALADFVLPISCASCGRVLDAGERGIVCGRCWSRLRLLSFPRCARCGHPNDEHRCRWCANLPAYVRAARSVCWATVDTGQRIVHALKYGGWWRVADGAAERMARLDWPQDAVDERSALVPVPLAASRLSERGYNQSECLARALGALWRIPVRADVLVRSRATQTQTRLTPDERVRNVHGAFTATAAAGAELRGAHVVLVDDVVTTAATMNACASALHEAGIRIISYVTFGRAPAIGDRL
jgi:ComF family protein